MDKAWDREVEKDGTGNILIFTDLDGTLLDASYSFQEALPALALIRERNIPLVICSSKTRAEIEHCRRELENIHPFISENGGGIFIPKRYFGFRVPDSGFRVVEENGYYVIKLGADYGALRVALDKLRGEGFMVRGFGDMTAEEVSKLTGLNVGGARRARERDFDEPFVLRGDEAESARLKKRIRAMGFNYTEGEYYHIMGDSDKGRAVALLKGLYEKGAPGIKTIALGDSPNDIEMLEAVDYPVAVQKSDGSYHPRIVEQVPNCLRAEGKGPQGWNRAVMELLT